MARVVFISSAGSGNCYMWVGGLKTRRATHTVYETAGSPASTASPAAPSSSAAPTGYFEVISSRSASPIHLLSLQARGGKFYLGGGGPSSYCPTSIDPSACPAGNTTVLAGGDGALSLGVVVPGGQQVYVAPDGSLSYTTAHSASKPEGAIVDGFSRTAPSDGNAFGNLNFEDGFVACDAGEGQGWQVYGQVEGAATDDDCLGFSALTVAVDDAGAWQY
ncbi:hypothetical protein BDW02DRAFT_588480 [Decorospora gaudefroyi]|uniref:Cell wall protein PhiA n=1 Tax=Decorospora gaudefroyi TaxID=184978 RepID=A0A6A5KL00_9PLEO|nr:hypothetical protein BDW02DRAFT_588480 [Decorospora gaudefroyi]